MNSLKLEPTRQTPGIDLDADSGVLKLYGRSYPSNADEFFTPIVEWFKEYAKSPQKETLIDLNIDFFNTSTAKILYQILHILKEVHKESTNVTVNWRYYYEDQDLRESGNAFSLLTRLPFNFIILDSKP